MSYNNLKSAVSDEQITRMMQNSLGKAEILSIRKVRGGLFNTSYKVLLKDRPPVVVRIAPPKERKLLWLEKDLLKREIWVYDKGKHWGLPVAAVLAHDFSEMIIERDYALFEYKSGKNLFQYHKYLPAAEMDGIYAELGNYAKIIHTIENREGWFGYPPPGTPYEKWSEFIRKYVNSLQEDMNGHPYITLPEDMVLADLLEKMTSCLDEIRAPHLIHGDLWLRNILIEKKNGKYAISAILDWDRSLYGDPYFEWVLYGAELPPAFWQAYGKEKPVKGSHDYIRMLFYRGCGGLQAALEEALHFGTKKRALEMLAYSIHDFRELKKECLCG